MNLKHTAALLAVATVTAASTAKADIILAPVAGTINSGGPGSGSLADTWNQNGLLSGYVNGVTIFDAYMATNPMHSLVFASNEWFGNSGTTSASVTYDMGAVFRLNALALWNEESSGIGLLNAFWSTDNVSFLPLFSVAPIDNPLADYPAQVITFAATNLRYVRFDMSGCPQQNPGSFQACAIGEVAFRTADVSTTPEPSTYSLTLAALVGIGLVYRRRRSV